MATYLPIVLQNGEFRQLPTSSINDLTIPCPLTVDEPVVFYKTLSVSDQSIFGEFVRAVKSLSVAASAVSPGIGNLTTLQFRAEGLGTTFTSGAGLEIKYGNVLGDSVNRGSILAYDRGANAYKSLMLDGLDNRFYIASVEAGRFTSNAAFLVKSGALVSGDGAGVYTWYSGGVGNISAVDAGVVGKQLDIYGYPVRFLSSNTSALWMAISTSGAVRFATYGAGTIVSDGSGNLTTSSDERLKHILGPFKKGLTVLRLLNPILHRWTEESGMDPKDIYVGFGAGATKLVFPEAIGCGKDGYLTLSDRALLALLINSVKQLDQKINW